MSDAEVREGRDSRNRFLPGNKHGAAGRPKGARDRHTRNFLEAFANDFEAHGAAVIEKVRQEQPAAWLKIAADLLPREATLDVDVNVMHDAGNLLEAYRFAAGILDVDPTAGLKRLRKIAPNLDIYDVGE